MYANKMKDMYQHGYYTDLSLTLVDGTNEVTMQVHKVILHCHSPYFEKLFDRSDRTLNQITVGVPNAHVIHDVIMSFYHQETKSDNCPDSIYALEKYLCRNFLCLEIDLNELKQLIVPSEGIELLVNVVSINNYHLDSLILLYRNLTAEYNLSQIPERIRLNLEKIKLSPLFHSRDR